MPIKSVPCPLWWIGALLWQTNFFCLASIYIWNKWMLKIDLVRSHKSTEKYHRATETKRQRQKKNSKSFHCLLNLQVESKSKDFNCRLVLFIVLTSNKLSSSVFFSVSAPSLPFLSKSFVILSLLIPCRFSFGVFIKIMLFFLLL